MMNTPSPFKNRRILAIPSGVGLAHLTRLILIARELKWQGVEVAFAYHHEANLLLAGEGFLTFHIAETTIPDFNTNIYETYTPALIEQCIQDELKAIEAFQPDLILSDFRLTAAISARVAQVPLISVVNGYLTDYFNIAEVMLPDKTPTIKKNLTRFATRRIQERQRYGLVEHFRTVAQKYGLKKLKGLHDFLQGDLTLIADLPQFCPLRNLPPDHRYIGPLVWEGANPENATLPPLDSHRPLIYVTTGNTGQVDLLNLVIEAFDGDETYQIVATTGAYISPQSIAAPENFMIKKFIPGSKIMALAQGVIHSGGNGTTYQALIIPSNNDQRINAWLIKKQNLGIPHSPQTITASQLRASFEDMVTDETINHHVQQFQQTWEHKNGAKAATLRIGHFLADIQ